MHRSIHQAAITWSVGALFWESMSALWLWRERWLIAMLAHLLCAVSLGCAAARGELRQRSVAAVSIAVWALCVPVLAPLGLCLVLLPALSRVRAQRPDGVLEIALARPKLLPPRAAQAGSMRELLTEMSDDSSQRVAVFMSLRHTELTRAAPLLRMALLDANEDIRLLAYALLERREKPVRARIQASQAELAHATTQRWLHLEQLCSDHWLLAEAGFVTGDTAVETLAAALDYGERALWLQNDPALRVLLGRICLRAHNPERALVHLNHASRLGTARSVLAPLRAHAVFQQGRYAEVGAVLEVSSAAGLARPDEQSARALWSGTELV